MTSVRVAGSSSVRPGRRDRGAGAVLVIEADEAYRAVIETCACLADCRAEAAVDLAAALARLERASFDVLIWGSGPEEDRHAGRARLLRARNDPPVDRLAGPLAVAPASPAARA